MKKVLVVAAIVGLSGCIIVPADGKRRNNNQSSSTNSNAGGNDAGSCNSASCDSASCNGGGGSSEPHYYVGGYRNAYPSLPDCGETKDFFRGNPNATSMPRGYYEGDIHGSNRGRTVIGAGRDETVIDGHMQIRGDGWIYRNMTITGDVDIRGNNNDVSQIKILGEVTDNRGNNNRLPGFGPND